jgi:hypothetical protein
MKNRKLGVNDIGTWRINGYICTLDLCHQLSDSTLPKEEEHPERERMVDGRIFNKSME